MDRGSLAAGGNDHAKLCGLSCAPGKSELLMIQPGKPKKEPPPNVTITIDGIAIKPAQQIRILGLLLQIDGKAQAAVTKMKTSAEQILGIIRRVSNRNRGLKEDDVMRLIEPVPIKAALPEDWKTIQMKPLPRNMTPGKDDERRTARAKAMARKLEENPRVMYADASLRKHSDRAAVVVTSIDRLIVNASLRTKDRAIAEEVAVTLALVEPSVDTVVTDSKIAYGSFRSGVISFAARAILSKCNPPGSAVKLVWVQAHSQVAGNTIVAYHARRKVNPRRA
ncbi:hypothetical protein HPB51_028553 [Rhipicephalus microplus]|uniref:Tick transposon n=1 Tax=Rhipicephalus microplus TaxID=6941 RepID=A0A9J6CWQ9_RHIMP|nr:hypothetical protein HPB51_028553 [Rhipicephalus microplus]